MWPEVMCLLQHSCEDDAIGARLGVVIWVGLIFYSGFWGERDVKVHILRHRRSPLSFSTGGASGFGGLCQRTAVPSPQRGQWQPVCSEHQGRGAHYRTRVHLD